MKQVKQRKKNTYIYFISKGKFDKPPICGQWVQIRGQWVRICGQWVRICGQWVQICTQ